MKCHVKCKHGVNLMRPNGILLVEYNPSNYQMFILCNDWVYFDWTSNVVFIVRNGSKLFQWPLYEKERIKCF